MNPFEQALEAFHEADRGVGRREEAQKGETELNDREEPTGLLDQTPDSSGPLVAFLDKLVEAASANRHEGDLGRDEEPLQQGQEDDDQELCDGNAHLGGVGVVRSAPSVDDS